MPEHKKHYGYARDLGIKIDEKTAKEIDRFLDFPKHPLTGERLPHKALHNWIGVKLVRERWGREGELYALAHLLLDRLNEIYVRKGLIPVIEEPKPKSLLEVMFEDILWLKLLEKILKMM
ncbi:MAG: hypothetical protein Q6368_001305 [Candidatus Baldrarchaeota archaeon]